MRKISPVILAAVYSAATAHLLAAEPQHGTYRVTILSDANAQGRSIDDLGLITGSFASGAADEGRHTLR